MAQIHFWGGGPKTWSESIFWQRFCFGMVSTTSLSLSMRGTYKIEIAEWKWPPIFQNKRVRLQEQTSWSSTVVLLSPSEAQTPTYVGVLLLFTHCRWMNTSTARQECAALSLYTTCRITDRRRTDVVVVCWLPKFHGFELAPLFYCGSKVEVNFANVCGFDTRRAPRNCSRLIG